MLDYHRAAYNRPNPNLSLKVVRPVVTADHKDIIERAIKRLQSALKTPDQGDFNVAIRTTIRGLNNIEL